MDPKDKDLDAIASAEDDSHESIISEAERLLDKDNSHDPGYSIEELMNEVKYLHELNSSQEYQ